jgi:hypothetical protein
MEERLFLALGDGLLIEHVIEEAHHFVVLVRSTTPASCCPLCGDLSDFIHSQYQRHLADVSCAGRAIQLHLTVLLQLAHLVTDTSVKAAFRKKLATP